MAQHNSRTQTKPTITPEQTKPKNNTQQTHTPIAWLYYILPPILLAAITVFVYWPSMHYAFQFDDVANITKHFSIRHNTFWQLFMTGSRWIAYWLNAIHFSIGRFDPFSYRVGNLIIHTINGMLTFFIIVLALCVAYCDNHLAPFPTPSSTNADRFLCHPRRA